MLKDDDIREKRKRSAILSRINLKSKKQQKWIDVYTVQDSLAKLVLDRLKYTLNLRSFILEGI